MKIWRLYAFFYREKWLQDSSYFAECLKQKMCSNIGKYTYISNTIDLQLVCFSLNNYKNCTWLSSRMDINLVFFVIIWTKQLLDLIQTVPTTSNSGMQWNYHWGNCQTGIERVIHLSSALSKRKTVLITSKMNNLNPKRNKQCLVCRSWLGPRLKKLQ